MIRLPSLNGTWRSAQNGEAFGDIVASKNIDLSEDGKVKLARRGMALFAYGTSYDVLAAVDPGAQGTFLGGVTGIGNGVTETDTSYLYWIAAIGTAYATRLDFYGTYTTIAYGATNAPTIGVDSDIVTFKGKAHVSGGAYVSDMDLGSQTWGGRRISGLTTGVPHPLCVAEHLSQLAVGNGNQVKTYDTSYANIATLTLPSEYVVTSIRWRQNNLYIGTRHVNGGEAKLFVWNGSGSIAQYGFGCGADWIYSLCEFASRMVICTSAGQIRSFNGGGFDDPAAFPVFYTPYPWGTTKTLNYIYGRVANRGMVARGSFLYINIDGAINNAAGVGPGRYLHNQPSGLWQFSAKSGLSHKAGVNFTPRLRLAPTALNSGYLATATPHGAAIGDPVVVAQGSLTGVYDGQTYYAIPDSATTLQLALTPQDALAGRAATLGGSVTGAVLMFDRTDTYGHNMVTNPGGVVALGGASIAPFYGSEVIYGAGLYDSTYGITKAALCSLGMGRNRGSFTTARLAGGDAGEFFRKIVGTVDSFALDTDQIVIKQRTSVRSGLPSPIAYSGTGATWTSTTTFTVDAAQKDVRNIQLGDELEIVSGAAAGYTCHVTLIDPSSSIFVFTVDEAMPVSSGTFDFIANNWTKVGTFGRANLAELRSGFQTTLDRVQGAWVQLKVELRGRDVALSGLQLSFATKQ